ncbi:MAG: transcriptional regulator [Hymenobacter sp.]|nr:transcriptional regulator [Hymenobacter sp.]
MHLLPPKLRQCRLDLHLTQEDAALQSGFSQRDISRFEKGRAKTIPNDYIQFLHKQGVDLNSLFDATCAQARFVSAAGPAPAAPAPAEPRIVVVTPDVAGNRTVPIVNRKAAASYLTGYQTQEYFEELDALTLPAYLLRGSGQGLVIQVVNDSMEDTIFEGDYLVCRLVERGQWHEITDFSVCVVVTDSRGVQVKRIKNRLVRDGLLRLSSDNRRYPSFNVFPDDIHQIWQVAFLLTANLPNRADTLYRKLDSLEDTTTDLRELYEQLREALEKIQP